MKMATEHLWVFVRDRNLIASYRQGNSMRQVASKFGISLERVRQILRCKAPDLIRHKHDTRQNITQMSSAERRLITSTERQ